MDIFNVASLIPEHRKEIVRDVLKAIKAGEISRQISFNIPMRPQEAPLLAKAQYCAESFSLFKKDLEGCGLKVGINVLFIMHGDRGITKSDDTLFPRCVGIDGNTRMRICPLNEDFIKYVRDVFAILAAAGPDFFAMDEDFRLEPGQECFCGKHLAELNKKTGTSLDRVSLVEILQKTDAESKRIGKAWEETLTDSLLPLARAARAGIDSVNPELLCEFKTVVGMGFVIPITKILAGKQKPVARIHNAMYMCSDPRQIPSRMHSSALQIYQLRQAGIDIFYSESDTYTNTRFATSAKILDAQITLSILEGVSDIELRYLGGFIMEGEYEHESKHCAHLGGLVSGKSGFYRKFSELVKSAKWLGPALPLPSVLASFWNPIAVDKQGEDCVFWFRDFCSRLGFPAFPGNEAEIFMLHGGTEYFTDDQIAGFLKKGLLLTGPAAAELCARGFAEDIGVTVESHGIRVDGERFADDRSLNGEAAGKTIPVNNGALALKTLKPISDDVKILSEFFKSPWHYSPNRTSMSPAMTFYKNKRGGRVAVCAFSVFSGFQAYNFINPIRKEQFVQVFSLLAGKPLPFIAADDYELCVRHGILSGGKEEMLCVFNMSLDAADNLRFLTAEDNITRIRRLNDSGALEEQKFSFPKAGLLEIDCAADTLTPKVFIINRT